MVDGERFHWMYIVREMVDTLEYIYVEHRKRLLVLSPQLREWIREDLREANRMLQAVEDARMRNCKNERCRAVFIPQRATQEYCSPACGNRARVARFAMRSRTPSTTPVAPFGKPPRQRG